MHGFRCEDMSIVTDDDKEVIGCSEWMRAERAVFDHIEQLHNDTLSNMVPTNTNQAPTADSALLRRVMADTSAGGAL